MTTYQPFDVYPLPVSEVIVSTSTANSPDRQPAALRRSYWPYLQKARERPRSREMDVAADPLAQLMERYANGEAEVFEQIYELLAPRLYRFCSRITAYELDADDCFQETLLRLHRARGTYVRGSNVLHWAYAIARSVYLTHLRHRRRHPERTGQTADVAERDDLPHAITPEAEVLAANLLDVATRELRRLSEKNRVAYILLKEEGVSAKEAAAVLGMSVDAVKQRAHRAYAQIRSALDAAG